VLMLPWFRPYHHGFAGAIMDVLCICRGYGQA
jgi:hypothetical protein